MRTQPILLLPSEETLPKDIWKLIFNYLCHGSPKKLLTLRYVNKFFRQIVDDLFQQQLALSFEKLRFSKAFAYSEIFKSVADDSERNAKNIDELLTKRQSIYDRITKKQLSASDFPELVKYLTAEINGEPLFVTFVKNTTQKDWDNLFEYITNTQKSLAGICFGHTHLFWALIFNQILLQRKPDSIKFKTSTSCSYEISVKKKTQLIPGALLESGDAFTLKIWFQTPEIESGIHYATQLGHIGPVELFLLLKFHQGESLTPYMEKLFLIALRYHQKEILVSMKEKFPEVIKTLGSLPMSKTLAPGLVALKEGTSIIEELKLMDAKALSVFSNNRSNMEKLEKAFSLMILSHQLRYQSCTLSERGSFRLEEEKLFKIFIHAAEKNQSLKIGFLTSAVTIEFYKDLLLTNIPPSDLLFKAITGNFSASFIKEILKEIPTFANKIMIIEKKMSCLLLFAVQRGAFQAVSGLLASGADVNLTKLRNTCAIKLGKAEFENYLKAHPELKKQDLLLVGCDYFKDNKELKKRFSDYSERYDLLNALKTAKLRLDVKGMIEKQIMDARKKLHETEATDTFEVKKHRKLK